MTNYISGADIYHTPGIRYQKYKYGQTGFSHILSLDVDNYSPLKIPAFRYIRSLEEKELVN